MKKKIIMALMVLTMAGSLIACGNESVNSETQEPVGDIKTTATEKEPEIEKEDNKGEESKMWGAYYENVMITGEDVPISFAIQFPSLVPSNTYKIAYQEDPTLALVGCGGADYRSDSLEGVLPACMERITMYIEMYRDWNYSDFAFNIDTTELITLEDTIDGDMPACKYTGTHTFKIDEEEYALPFVAYAVDLQQGEEAYMYLMVMDESALYPDRPAVEEGVIEDYAYRMAHSLHVRD